MEMQVVQIDIDGSYVALQEFHRFSRFTPRPLSPHLIHTHLSHNFPNPFLSVFRRLIILWRPGLLAALADGRLHVSVYVADIAVGRAPKSF